MSTPLLKTKLYVPSVRPASFGGGSQSALQARLVARPRLIKRLDQGFRQGCRLTLVSAPAGYGKTTLLAEWIAVSELRACVAWLSLDSGDNDPTRFWAYVIAALQTVQEDLGRVALAALQSPQPPPIEHVLTGLLNQIAELPSPVVLVLDDYHVIQGDAAASQAIHDALAFLVDNMPEQMHLVLATRADPPLPIPRLRGRGQLNELYQADLRFTSDEVAQFLERIPELELSVEDATALERRTEGWIAALHMARLQMSALAKRARAGQAPSMRVRDDVSRFVRAFAGSHRYVLDYLGEEVLKQQPKDVQAFLRQTSILDRLSGELCDAVIGAAIGATRPAEGRSFADSQAMLEYLERNNLFVVPLDDERRWYRYHHLFADLLRQRLWRERRDLVPELHCRASNWYEQSGWIPEAVNHALSALDYDRASELIERTAWAMLTRGDFAVLLGWLEALPEKLVRSRSRLGILCAWSLTLTGQFDSAEAYLLDIDVQQEPEVFAIRAHIAGLRDDGHRAIELARQAFEHLPEENLFLRGYLALNLGLALWRSGDMAAGSRVLVEAISLGRAAGSIYLTLVATARLGHVKEMQGLLDQAVATHQAALQLAAQQSDQPVPYAGVAHVGIAEVLYEQNDLDGALRYATEGIKLCEMGGISSYLLAGRFILAQVLQARGDIHGALAILERAERLAKKYDYTYLLAEQAELRAQLWLRQGNVQAAVQWVQEREPCSVDDLDLTIASEKELIAVMRVLVARGSPRSGLSYDGAASWGKDAADRSLRTLAKLADAAEAAERAGSAIRIRALQALAFSAQGATDRALMALKRALRQGESQGYVRTFVDEGEPMARLLRQALSRGIAPDYVARLLAAFGSEAEVACPASDALVEPLSRRELDVLRLIVAGLSNPEIADELVIAVSTVKSHVNHIFGKLGADSRTRAVARARELGLF